MLPFELHVPTTLDEALGLLDQHGDEARPIAGGTALTLLMQHVLVPRPRRPLQTAYLKFLPRTADDYPTVGVAVAVDVVDGRCEDVRIGISAAGPTPIRARAAEDVLRGQALSPELLRAAAATVPPITDPVSDHRGSANYKRRMAEVFTRRA